MVRIAPAAAPRSLSRQIRDIGVDTNNVVAYFVGFFEAISELPRVGDSPHPHRSLEGGEVLKLLTDIQRFDLW
jgi:hypothetical protein